MTQRFQRTIAAPVTLSGVGVHSGKPATITFRPAPADAGVWFQRADLANGGGPIPARIAAVCDARRGTTLQAPDGAEAATVEHVLSAVFGVGVDNLEIELTGPEAPIMDGSSLPYAEALLAAGVLDQPTPAQAFEILSPIEVRHGDRRAALLPAAGGEGLDIDVTIAFSDPAIGVQRLTMAVTAQSFLAGVAPARTFGYLEELEPLQAGGRALGASMENSIVVSQGRVLNPEGLRFPDEFVRHKALDLIGDLALLGAPVIGRCLVERPGHALTVALMQAAMARPEAWRLRHV